MDNNYTAGEKAPKTTIFYYTGTGNSLWIARNMALELGNAEVVSMMNSDNKQPATESQVIGVVFPVHIWGVPKRVLEFLDRLQYIKAEYIFAVANHGGQVANTLVQLANVMKSKGLDLSAGWEITMPSNYIPWGGPGSLEKQNRNFIAARSKISRIVQGINQRVQMSAEKGPLWQRIVFTWIYKISFPHIPEMDNGFWTDDRCNQCGICVKVCPNHNVLMQEGKLIWQKRCEQCLACLQWCPQESLQLGKKTSLYKRYHHPEVKLKDVLKQS